MSAKERTSGAERHGTGLLLLLVLVVGAVMLTALPDDDNREGGAACAPRKVGSWQADERTTGEFVRYGNDASRADDWTGGDGTHSVRLPDGRVLWLFSDTYLGQVHAPPNLSGQPHAWRDNAAPFVRNSAVVMSAGGSLERTLPAPLFANPSPQEWRWPVAAKVEPRSPGSDQKVVRVLLWTRATAGGPWIYGVPTATEVATLSLPDLRVESIVKVSDQTQIADPAKRVLYGTTAVDGQDTDRGLGTEGGDGYTYVFGGNDGKAAARPASNAYLARVPDGSLADPGGWEYWDGEQWTDDGRKAKPVLGNGAAKGVGSAFTVVRDDGTWVLFTMAAGTEGLTTVTSYWACSPTGPWHGPAKGFAPPMPQDGAPKQDTAVYNPQAHPALESNGGRLLLSYDVNWLDATPQVAHAQVSRNVALYRPRFVRLRLAPAD
ncbi:DUF4185 domain-containing protein [Streptomyces sp. T-3]|nr:DUF4185 domain-containing protein [Streptomyces sp. T-3]